MEYGLSRALLSKKKLVVIIALIGFTMFLACSSDNNEAETVIANLSTVSSLDSNVYVNEKEFDSTDDVLLNTVETAEGSTSRDSDIDLDTSTTPEFSDPEIGETDLEINVTSIVTESIPKGVYGGVLRFASEYEDLNQDVHFEVSPTLASFGPGIIYSRVLRFTTGPDVSQPSLDIECDVCESWQMTTPTSFKFKLRDGVRWHNEDALNNRILSSQDVVYSLSRQLTGPNSVLLGSISEISVVNDLEFVIDLKFPDADFIMGLADARSKILNSEVVDNNGYLTNSSMVGTGPWKLSADSRQGVHKFEKNQFYFESDFPYADGLNLYLIPDEMTRETSFVVGQLDAIHLNDTQLRQFESNFDVADYLFVPETGMGVEISLNPNTKPFDDIDVRKAVLSAIDPWSYISGIWSDAGYVSLGMPMINNDWLIDVNETSKYFNNISNAKSLLDRLSIDPVKIKVGKFGANYIEHAEMLKKDLTNVGFDVEIEEVSRIDFVDNVWKGGDYQIFIGPAPYVNSPNIYLFSVIHSEGLWHHGNPLVQELDLAIEIQSGEYDHTKRRLQHQRIQKLIWESFTRFMPVTRKSIWLVQDWLENFYPTSAGFEYNYLSESWIKQ